MQLRNHVEWALHCCAILAGLPEERHLAAKDLAELHGVPKEYLSKALQALSAAGLVESVTGPAGGYRLAQPPKKITFLDIVEAVEGKASTFVCTEIRRNNPCKRKGGKESKACGIARIMWEADEAWRARLRGVTLADLLATLERDLPAELRSRTAEWVMLRT